MQKVITSQKNQPNQIKTKQTKQPPEMLGQFNPAPCFVHIWPAALPK